MLSDKEEQERADAVLILVLLGYGLVDYPSYLDGGFNGRLNPCFVGIWSCSMEKVKEYVEKVVLILVLLGYGLVALYVQKTDATTDSLNPCFVGIWSCRRGWGVFHHNSDWVLILVLLGYGLVERIERSLPKFNES